MYCVLGVFLEFGRSHVTEFRPLEDGRRILSYLIRVNPARDFVSVPNEITTIGTITDASIANLVSCNKINSYK